MMFPNMNRSQGEGSMKSNYSKYIIIFIAILAFIIAWGCSRTTTNIGPGGQVKFQTVLSTQQSLADTASVYLCDSNGQWKKIWRMATGQIDPQPELPKIDFGQNYILAIFMGKKGASGHRNEIVKIVKKGQKLIVTVENHHATGGMFLPVVTSPFHIVTIPKGNYKLDIRYVTIND